LIRVSNLRSPKNLGNTVLTFSAPLGTFPACRTESLKSGSRLPW